MSLEAEQAVYRMLQEALANIARHSHAKQVDISLDFSDTDLAVKIEDDGQGFDLGHKPNGIGLRTIIDRADEIGGQARVKSAPGKGTIILIDLPLS
jgi:signal transduction histidine kinase